MSGPRSDDELLTAAEIAAILKINQQTVRDWLDAGTHPRMCASASGGSVSTCDFEAFLADCYDGPVSIAAPVKTILDGVLSDPVVPQRTMAAARLPPIRCVA